MTLFQRVQYEKQERRVAVVEETWQTLPQADDQGQHQVILIVYTHEMVLWNWHFTCVIFLSKTDNPRSNYEKIIDKCQLRDILQYTIQLLINTLAARRQWGYSGHTAYGLVLLTSSHSVNNFPDENEEEEENGTKSWKCWNRGKSFESSIQYPTSPVINVNMK